VALPHSSEVFAAPALTAVRSVLDEAESDEVESLLERVESSVFGYWDAHPTDEEAEAAFVDAPAPSGLFDRVVTSLSELEAALDVVDPRWRLDVALAVDDLSDRE
jgi:hypothetical protein